MMQLTGLVGLTILNDLNDALFYDVCTTFTQLTSMHVEATEKFGGYQLRHLTKLQSLWVSPGQRDLQWISIMTPLTSLSLRIWPEKDFKSLLMLTNLVSLYIEDFIREEDMLDLATITQLQNLNIPSCYFHSSLVNLINLTALQVACITNNNTLPPNVISLFLDETRNYTGMKNLSALCCRKHTLK
jgi:hypothetical protein